MSPKRLKWTGILCLACSILIAGLGFFAHIALVVLGILFHVIIIMHLNGNGRHVESMVISVPRVLEMALLVAGLIFAVALACLVEWRRRVHVEGRRSKPTWTISGVE